MFANELRQAARDELIARKSDVGAASALAAGAIPALVLHLGAAGSGDDTRCYCASAISEIAEYEVMPRKILFATEKSAGGRDVVL